MSKELREKIENIIGKGMGWIKYDDPDDYELSPFAGMWVGDEGKTGYDLTKAKFLDEIVDMVERESNKAVIDKLSTFLTYEENQPGYVDWDFLASQIQGLKEQIGEE